MTIKVKKHPSRKKNAGKGPRPLPRSARKKSKTRKALRQHLQGGSSAIPPENPRALKLAQRIATLVGDKKAIDVVIIDVRGKTSYADYFVLASGESERQVVAMAEHVEVQLKTEEGTRTIGSEGQETGHWVLLDYGEVVAHLFFTDVRAFYDLEGLWADAPRAQAGDAA